MTLPRQSICSAGPPGSTPRNPGSTTSWRDASAASGRLAWKRQSSSTRLAEYREAAHLRPDLVGHHFNLGGILLSLGKSDEAVAAFRDAAGLAPDDVDYHEALGACLASLGKFFEALAEYRVALRLRPDDS